MSRALETYARETWRAIDALTVPETGLPADSIGGGLAPGTRAPHTSPTNIAMSLWAAVVARDLGFIGEADSAARARRTLSALARLEHHAPSGQLYNWYHPATLALLEAWPEPPGHPVHPFASSVDNGWLACALLLVQAALPALGEEAAALLARMRFDAYYDPRAKGSGPGLLRGGFWRAAHAPAASGALPRADYAGTGEVVVHTGHHYGVLNTEARIASYVGIALGQLPREHYFAPARAYPAPAPGGAGRWAHYLGVDVFEGALERGGGRLLPSWGGSMFEALMPTLVVPEAKWGPRSWALTHPLYVDAQLEFGREHAQGYWGFSPAADPAGGYREYGVPGLGAPGHAYAPASGGGPVVTPHAAFLALAFRPEAALENLARLRQDFPEVYGPGGFKDSVDVASGRIADRYLALDQGMALAAAAGALGSSLQRYVAPALEPALAPLMQMEAFGAGPPAAPR